MKKNFDLLSFETDSVLHAEILREFLVNEGTAVTIYAKRKNGKSNFKLLWKSDY